MGLARPKAVGVSLALLVVVCLAVLYREELVSGVLDHGDDHPAEVHAPYLRLPAIISDHMVLQQAPASARIWGWCFGDGCAAQVMVRFGDNSMEASSRREKDGKPGEESWEVLLPPTNGTFHEYSSITEWPA